MYAFWKYDHYPYLLGGKVTCFDVKFDTVQTEVTGPGYNFKPVLMVPDNIGKQLLIALENLKTDRENAYKALNDSYRSKLDTLLRGLEIFSPPALRKDI